MLKVIMKDTYNKAVKLIEWLFGLTDELAGWTYLIFALEQILAAISQPAQYRK